MRIESLLSARLHVAPQLVGEYLYFVSNLGGRLSLYRMKTGGSMPELLLPPHIALQNPELIGGYAFYVFPELAQILVMIDQDGDENYEPMLIPLDGGFPEPAFGDRFAGQRVHCTKCDEQRNIAYFGADGSDSQRSFAYRADLRMRTVTKLAESLWGSYPVGANRDHTKVVLEDGYTVGDSVYYLWTAERGERDVLYGTPLEDRAPDQQVPLTAFGECYFTPDDRGLVFTTALFEDTYGLGYLDLAQPNEVRPVVIEGTQHIGVGELVGLEQLHDDRYRVSYNIDGVSWAYEGSFDETARTLRLDAVICGTDELANGVYEALHYDTAGDTYALSFSTATSPTQIYTVTGSDRKERTRHTNERALGIEEALLSPGEDASFVSFDGTRVSARLYLPAAELGLEGPRPLVYYIHGGPQSQERPDFGWFSMPLIQFLTLNGFAVFVPNARGSTGYGLSYTKLVDRDWGGNDRLDHVHAMREVLPRDKRIDVKRAGVVGRSYGGYMTLTLATRHPELWTAAVDMFGPYDLLTFADRVPESWKPYISIAIGDPVKERDFLIERSPATYIDQLSCPLLVIQGKNDPRVIERESRDVVEQLRERGKQVDYLMFENEGHDVLKFENRVRCYNAITDFFRDHLRP